VASILKRLEAAWRAAIAPPPRMKVSEWAEKNLIISKRIPTPFPGKYQIDRTPYAREILDAFTDPTVEHMTLCVCAQGGKSQIAHTTLGFVIDQDPGPALVVISNADMAKTVSENRIQPLIDDCPALARHKPTDPDKYRKLEMEFDSMSLALVGSNSPANLASRPVRYLWLDEVDKYPAATKKEAAAFDLAIERTKAFWNRRIMELSTPTIDTGRIWKSFLQGDQRFLWIPCPHCRETQPLVFGEKSILTELYDWENVGAVRWDPNLRDDNGEWRIEEVKATAWYECGHCKGPIKSSQKDTLLNHKDTHWKPEGTVGSHRSWHLSALYPLWITFGDFAAKFLSSSGDPDALRNTINSWFSEPWKQAVKESDYGEIAAHRANYRLGRVPGDALMLICTVDVQHDELIYEVRAWSYYGTNWLVRYGRGLSSWAMLESILDASYEGIEGEEYGIRFCYIDATDGNRTHDVYQFCAKRRAQCIPVINTDQYGQTAMLRIRRDAVPGYGLTIWNVDPGLAADQLYRQRLSIPPDNPGFWHLPEDVGADYLKSLATWFQAEAPTASDPDRKKWKAKNREIEHYGDTAKMQEVAAFHHQFAVKRPPPRHDRGQQRTRTDGGPGGWGAN